MKGQKTDERTIVLVGWMWRERLVRSKQPPRVFRPFAEQELRKDYDDRTVRKILRIAFGGGWI